MLQDLQRLAARYAARQHTAAALADDTALQNHITHTLRRCLPVSVITAEMVDHCYRAVCQLPEDNDPMHTGAIHTFAGSYLVQADADDRLMKRLHSSALRLLPADHPASRDDLRLVTLDALYSPGLLPPGEHTAYLKRRLGLGCIRLSHEEIALRMHKPLVYIHEMEAAILTLLTSHYAGGFHA